LNKKVVSETKKLSEADFIREEKHADLITNSPREEKNGHIRVCIDFKDLNKACLKDDFLLPIPKSGMGYEFGS